MCDFIGFSNVLGTVCAIFLFFFPMFWIPRMVSRTVRCATHLRRSVLHPRALRSAFDMLLT